MRGSPTCHQTHENARCCVRARTHPEEGVDDAACDHAQRETVDSAEPVAVNATGVAFASAVAAIAALPLDDDEKAEALRHLLAEHDAAGT